MSAVLPRDLLNISTTEIQCTPSTDHADVLFERAQVLHMFWKVHAIRYKVSRHISDERSRNLFWRTWSNPDLSKSISTSSLTTIWDTCRGDLNLSSFDLVIRSKWSQLNVARSEITPSSAPVAQLSPDHKRSQPKPFDLPDGNAGLSPTAIGGGRSQHGIDQPSLETRDVINEAHEIASPGGPKPTRGMNSRNTANRTNNSGRERTNARGRARPSLARRRSTQSGKILKSPTIDPAESKAEEDEVMTLPTNVTKSTLVLSSASSWEDEQSAESQRISPAELTSETIGLAIDKDFRGRFVERIASTSNLASMNRIKKTGSVVRFADEVPMELRKPKAPLSTTFENQTRPSLPHRQSAASVAISDGDAEEDSSSMFALQRTASSLSMLLRTAQLEDGSLPTEMSLMNSRSRKGEKEDEKAANEEEALLAMGRRGGVTKAGGIQLPPQQRLKDDIDSSFGSPSPDRIF